MDCSVCTYTVCVCFQKLPGQVIEWCHPEACDHSSLPLFRQQFMPHSLFTALGMFHLKIQIELLKENLKLLSVSFPHL